MPHVLFTGDFDFTPKPSVTICYKAGMRMLVTRTCAEEAIAAGKAKIVERVDAGR